MVQIEEYEKIEEIKQLISSLNEKYPSIEDLSFSTKVTNCFKRAKIFTFNDLIDFIQEDYNNLNKIRYFGNKAKEEVINKLFSFGIDLNYLNRYYSLSKKDLEIIKEEKQESKEKTQKAKYWTLVLYPDSLPMNYIDILTETGCPVAISPLHDKDLDFDGEEYKQKKEHYHCIICYPNSTTYNNVLQLTKELNGPIPKKLANVKGMLRYFTHEDNPEKQQYNKHDIKYMNGFDPDEFINLTSTQVLEIKHDVMQLIKKYMIFDYIDLLEILYNLNFDWYTVACNNTLFFTTICKSAKYKTYTTETKLQQERRKIYYNQLQTDKEIEFNLDIG